MNEIVKTTLGATLILSMLVLFVCVMAVSYDRQLKVHCNNLQAQSTELKGFFVSSLDKSECASYGITIDAPVR